MIDKKIDIHKSGGILIRDRKFLITRAKGKTFFIAPGGKVEPGEGVEDALIRELKEELDIAVKLSEVGTFGTFFALAAGDEEKHMQMDVFLIKSWNGEITPTNEVEEVKWINSNVPVDIEVGSVFRHDVLPLLKEQNLID